MSLASVLSCGFCVVIQWEDAIVCGSDCSLNPDSKLPCALSLRLSASCLRLLFWKLSPSITLIEALPNKVTHFPPPSPPRRGAASRPTLP